MNRSAKQIEIEKAAESGELLPEGWGAASVLDLSGTIQYGHTASAIQNSIGPRFLRITDIQNGTVDWNSVPTCAIKKLDLEKYRLLAGDIVFARTGATTGKSFLIKSCPEAVFASYLIRVRAATAINPIFLWFFFQTPQYWQFISENVAGNAQPGCNASKLAALQIPVPPRAEQDRIVLKARALLEEVNKSRARIANVPKLLKAFRQAVLAAACSGKLTEDWREEYPGIELSSELEKRLRGDRRAEWTTRELARMQSKGTHRSDEKWRSKYLEPENPDATEEVPDLPATWCEAGIELLLSLKRKGMKTGPFGSSLNKSEHQKSGIPVLGIENIGEMKFVEGSKIHVSQSKADELAEFDAQPGDILISRSGTVGEVCVVPDGLGEARISTNIMRLTLRDSGMLPTFFCYLFNGSPFVLRQVAQLCGGSTRDFLNQTILLSILFPVPPLHEQREIVRRVEALFKLADAIEKRVAAATLRAERLTQAILAKAFRGELVPTEADLARREGRGYESASVLLERIKKERERVEQKRPKHGKKAKELAAR
jgi:type I restriction enzyme, S subunit